MRRALISKMDIVFALQKLLLALSFNVCRFFVRPEAGLWAVGVDEVANVVHTTGGALADAYTINLSSNKYYKRNHYDFQLRFSGGRIGFWLRLIIGPCLLGYLVNRVTGFFYIWNTGFLLNEIDGRLHEFSFLKRKEKKLVACFCGSDIRSLRLSRKDAQDRDMAAMATYLPWIKPSLLDNDRELLLQKTAQSADEFADHIFNAPVDQISYLQRDTYPFIYFFPDEKFNYNSQKFDDIKIVKIVHAPSSPVIKGTQLVHAALKKLRVLGYEFDYVEIMGMDNETVLAHLRDAHIALNEFYAFVPGVFGIEAMANHCAVLTSADRTIEPSLAAGANDAWFVTGYWEIFDHLKNMLDDHGLIRRYADQGYQWTYDNYRTSQAGATLRAIISGA